MVYTHNRSVAKVFSFFLIASVSVVAMLVSAPVSSALLEEIIVTAQKRDENLQTVPLSVSAYSQERLTRIGANNVERLGALTPGLEWGQFGMSTKVSIRGQSTASSEANTDGSVALFIDGIYLGRGQQMWSAMTDVERVEVLRGPQGTLFGRNAVGGSINIITKKPSKEIEAKFEATAGNYDHISTSGHFNLPITDSLAARVSFLQEDHDGYLVNRFEPDESQLDEDMWYVRGALRFEDGGPLTVDLAVDYYDQGGNGNGFSGVKFFDQLTPEINTWVGALGAPGVPGNTTEDWVFEGNRSYRDTESVTVALTINYDLTENINVKSISGYSDFSQLAGGETDFHTAFLADCRLFTDAKLYSTELQVSSIGAETLEWLVGFYYLDEEIVERFVFEFMPGAFGGSLDPRVASTQGGPLVLDFSNRLGTATAESMAFFGQATYHINDQFSLTGGIRYTKDDKTYVSNDSSPFADPLRADTNAANSFEEVTWRAGAEHQIDDSKMVYVTVSTGFKSGGFNRFNPPTGPGALVYDLEFGTETIINYEIGFKGDFLDGTLRTNIAAYTNDITDFQSYAFDDSVPTSITANAASAKTYGVEAELTYIPVEPAEINFILTWLDAYYVDYAEFNNGSVDFDASGNNRELSPEWKFTLAGAYDFDLGSFGTLTPYFQSTYKSHYFVTAANIANGLDKQDSYTQTDIKLIWNSNDGHWRGEVFWQNIEDNFVKTGAFLATSGFWITYGPEPSLIGGRLSYTF